MKTRMIFFLLYLFSAVFAAGPANAESEIRLSKGQSLYVPVYSHIYSGNKERPFDLTVTLSIRNTDAKHSIHIEEVNYYDSMGKLIKKYLEQRREMAPLESIRFVIGESEKAGGSGANFIVEWESEEPVNLPVVESVMIGTQGQQGISFTSRSQAVKAHDE